MRWASAAKANAIASANAAIPLAIRFADTFVPSNGFSNRARVPVGAIPRPARSNSPPAAPYLNRIYELPAIAALVNKFRVVA